MFVNLLTEDNLPSYHREIATRFGRDGAWGTWVGRWTAEENRHGIAMVPEGRRLFPSLTVEENLLIGTYGRKGEGR